MATHLIFLIILIYGISYAQSTNFIIQTYNRPSIFKTQKDWYSSILKNVIPSSTTSMVERRIFYEYETVMQGFAANLSPEEVLKISRVDGVIGVYEDRVMKLQTTRSPYFLGLNEQYGVWPEAKFGQDVIIGLLDSGIWPESASFNDDGLGPVSSRWKGQCETGIRFNASNCNNKLVGARFFYSGRGAKGIKMENQTKNLTPRDWVGHGTHTAAIAAGSTVLGANMFGLAKGAARGTAPRARLAVYKVCWNMYYGCDTSDILKGIEKAIEDGVDIISMSLGGDSDKPTPLYEDLHAIGTFAAVRHGIFVACAGGNNGPDHYSVDNVMPWVTTVGGSAVDRTFLAHITLGNGDVFNGESLFSNEANYTSRMVPILFPIHGVCDKKNLVTSMIRGKIVVCSDSEEEWDGVLFIEKAGGVGIIKVDNIGDAIDDIKSFNIPSININIFTFAKIVTYLKSTENPVAKLDFRKIVIGDRRAPTVAGYSSRGPSIVLPEILKPDILAPGSNILSAWPSEVPLFDEPRDPRRSNYNILKGTSMSCPHVAGIGALLHQVHPLWSPAMIRSALMTTASLLDNYLRPILLEESSQNATPFEFGAGHVNPQRALDPGLVYDAGVQDYIDLLCTLNYTEKQIHKFAPPPIKCSKFEGGVGDLNYPSFVANFTRGSRLVHKRILTSVSKTPMIYEVRIVNPSPHKVEIVVSPTKLEFKGLNDKKSYNIEFRSKVLDPRDAGFKYAYVIWENIKYQVKSPVAFVWE